MADAAKPGQGLAIPTAATHHPHMTQSLQERYAPNNACFGCGPANADGLRIRSIVDGEEVVCEW